MCDKITIQRIHIDQFSQLSRQLEDAGFRVAQTDWTHGVIEGRGIKIKYQGGFYTMNDRVANITLTVEKKPWYVSCDKIRKEISKRLPLSYEHEIIKVG